MRTTPLWMAMVLIVSACGPSDTETAREPSPTGPAAPGLAQTVEWDQGLLDFLLVQMQLTERLSNAVATRTNDPALRAYAEDERAAARRWRDELGAFRARWFPDAPPVTLTSAPTLTELGPTSRDLAARQGPAALDRTGGKDPRATAPAQGQLAEGGDPDASKPAIVERNASARLPEGQEIDMGRAGEVDGAAAPATTSSQDEARLLAGVDERVALLEAGPVDVRAAAEALAPMHQRALAGATIGARGAAHPELRDLSDRIRLEEQRALERLRRLSAGDRG
ncbi:MAG: hypothetical protein V4850_15955 [Myxococcota bacterium]